MQSADVFVINKAGKYNIKYFRMEMRSGVPVWSENPNTAATFNSYGFAEAVAKEWGLRVYKISPMRIYGERSPLS